MSPRECRTWVSASMIWLIANNFKPIIKLEAHKNLRTLFISARLYRSRNRRETVKQVADSRRSSVRFLWSLTTASSVILTGQTVAETASTTTSAIWSGQSSLKSDIKKKDLHFKPSLRRVNVLYQPLTLTNWASYYNVALLTGCSFLTRKDWT
jgi:hypothetical protein